jgi:PAS domain S-box-containing protein
MVTLYVSPQVETILGLSQREWLSDPSLWERHLHPDDREAAMASFLGLIETGKDEVSEYRMIRPDGRTVWIDDRATLVRDDSGRPVLLQGVMLDITERKEAEEAVRASEERYRMLFERNPQPMWVFDLDTLAFLAVNDAAVDRYGYSRDEFLSMTILDIRPPGDAARVLEDVRRRRSGLDSTNSWVHTKKDGTRMDVEITTHQMEFAGRPARLTLAIDVTDRNRATAELRASMEALQRALQQRQDLLIHLANVQEDERRRIASDIHDDSIQKMTAVGLRLQTLRRHLTDPDEIRAHDELAETVRLSIGRLRRLLFELRPPALDRDGLAAAVRLYLQETAREAGFEAGLENRLTDEPPLEIRMLVYRVAQEAITNARKHARGSRVDVELETRDGGILVRVQDDGEGFDPSNAMGRTAPGHLGINAMRERTEMAGGWWRVESAPDTGTTVEFWVPIPTAAPVDDQVPS